MDENISTSTPPRRRRHRTRWELFKEAYLPYIILGVAAVIILIFIVGAWSRGA